MNNIDPVNDTNLSTAWVRGFLALMRPGCAEINPLIITVTANHRGECEEQPEIRLALDAALAKYRKDSSHTVANTIFPKSLWNPSSARALLYERYMKHAWPRVKKCHANNRGTYFQRLIDYENGLENGNIPINQLEHVIATWHKGNHRHSALQLSIFDPRRDHKDSRRLGFPCLHQVCFTPLGQSGCEGLSVTGFYATQYVFEKAYGNYLGLWRLGQFVAHEMKLKLVQMTCIAASARLGVDEDVNKTDLSELKKVLVPLLSGRYEQAVWNHQNKVSEE